MQHQDLGLSTLISLSEADKFNEWMFDAIRPYIAGKTLEIGSGIGNISAILVRHQLPLYVSDHTDEYTARLRSRFAGTAPIKGVLSIDLVEKNFDTVHADIVGTFDTVFALNVIEHIEDDHLAIRNCYRLLKPGGRVVILVPAWPALYNRLDKGLEHYRRYSSTTLRQLLSGPFEVTEMRYFNLAGIGGWWLTGTLLRRKVIGEGRAKVYNRLVPLFRLADKLSFHRMGLSLVAVGEKK
ncbi:MAG TPA: class I SAM-dependent methyltransferase [Puia sp.]|nr:class I SAM-dependent methyltransferase [Puia sp.]